MSHTDATTLLTATPAHADARVGIDKAKVLSQAVAACLWPIALGLGLVYVMTAISHWFRLSPPVRDPLTLAAAVTSILLLLAAVVLYRRPVKLSLAHPVAVLLSLSALINEVLHQQMTPDPSLQIYISLYLVFVCLSFLSTGWLVLCIMFGLAGWGLAVWRDMPPHHAVEWIYVHGVAICLGLAMHAVRRRAIIHIAALRQADAIQTAHLKSVIEQLRESEELFRQFADHSGQVFWINDGKTHQVNYINRVYESLVGRPIEQLRHDPLDWIAAVHPEDRDRITSAYLECTVNKNFDELYRILHDDGEMRWVHDHGFLIRDEPSDTHRIGGIMQDVTDRVLAQQQLMRSEQTNIAMLAAIPDMILRVKRDGSFILVQRPRNFEAPWLSPDQSPQNLRDILPPALLQLGEQQIELVMSTGQMQTHEYPWPDESSVTWREWRISPISPDEVLVIVRDITSRKQIERELTRSRQQLSELIADLDGIVWECSPDDFHYTFVSPRAEKILGYPLEQWLTQPSFFMDRVHPDDRERIEQYRHEKVMLGLDHEMNHRMIAADNRVIWVHNKTRVVRDDHGKPVRLCGLLIDVSDSMRSAQALRDSQMILDRAQNIAQLGSWTWDTQAGKVIWSQQMYRIYGITPEQFDGSWMRAYEMIHPEDQSKVWELSEQVLRTGEVEQFEYRLLRGDGTERIVRADGELQLDEQGNVSRIIGTVQDITDLRSAEAERERLEDELRQMQKLDAVGTLANGVAHDFNNLLTAVRGYADLIRHSLPADHPANPSLDMIDVATDQAAGVTQSLLTFAHHTPFEKKPVDLGPNIRLSLKLLRRLLPASVELVEDLPTDPVYVNADAHQLQQVWLNLTINARDAMAKGGKLIVKLRKATDAPTNPQDSWHGQSAETAIISVTDNGTGMCEKTIARIFEPYFTTKPRDQGTGLGLSIVHGIISDHAGRVRVQSEVGKGTRFTIYLPCCKPPEPRSISATKPMLHAGQGETILLAEDNEFVRAIMVSSLQAAGYNVISTSEGDQVVDVFEMNRDRIRMLVLDVDLPRQSGDQCLRQIREIRSDIPAILMTGNTAAARHAPDGPQDILLTKPFQIGRLVECVDQLLRSSAASSRVE